MTERGILSQRHCCTHPPEDRMENPKRLAQTLCGKCGAVVQSLDAELLVDTAKKIRRDTKRK